VEDAITAQLQGFANQRGVRATQEKAPAKAAGASFRQIRKRAA